MAGRLEEHQHTCTQKDAWLRVRGFVAFTSAVGLEFRV